ncbi:hypothetical protein C1645_794331 [Glomus cerebriforme]|uniref:Uncharacterized protein n=1 Tax=Glomus cerebriforme TaxID=658196 RepID=A0A397RZ14_9GLOM|nr:hypothetical protein C1645_794331 [Glomus cerebriforme]
MGNLKLGDAHLIFIALYATPWCLSVKILLNVRAITLINVLLEWPKRILHILFIHERM